QMALLVQIVPAPEQGIVDAEAGKDLRQLADVAEEIADEARVAWLHTKGARDSATVAQVAHERFAGDEEFIGEDIPRADADAAGLGQVGDRVAMLGTDLEVVLEDNGLAVTSEGALQAAIFVAFDEAVHQLDQPVTIVLERLVPFAIP